jgi:hypothetical protein
MVASAMTRRAMWPVIVVVLALVGWVAIHAKRETLVDFDVYRTAATRALVHAPLYRPEDKHYQFKYLPAFAIFLAPFAFPSYTIASISWYALSVALLCVFMQMSLRLLPDRRVAAPWLLALVVLCTGKFWVKELTFGQANLLFGVILAGALSAADRGWWRVAGALGGFGTLIKPYAVLFYPWLAIAGGLEAAAFAVVVLAAGLLLPSFTYGWGGNLTLIAGWYRTVTDTTPENLLHPENISFATMWAKWLGAGALASRLAIVTELAALGFFATVMAMRRRVRHPLYLEFGLLMLMVPLLSPQGWDYVLLIAAPAFFLLFDRWPSTGWLWRAVTVLAVFLVSFTIFDVLGRTVYIELTALSVVTLGGLLLMLCLGHLRWRALA